MQQLKEKTIDFIRGREDQVLSHFGYRITGNHHIDCPACGKKKHFRISHEYKWICTCTGRYGNLISLVMEAQGREFKSVCDEIDEAFGNCGQEAPRKKRPNVIQKFQTLDPIKGSMAEQYLRGRGIKTMPSHGVKFNLHQWHSEEEHGDYSSMVALATDHRLEPCKTHITHLYDNNKAGTPVRRLVSTGPDSQNVSIKLFDPEPALGIAEGIESSLSAAQVHSMPVWSTLNTALMKRFRAPRGVKVLHIYMDHDKNGAGLAAASHAAWSNVSCKNDVKTVYIRWTEALGDWNDYLRDPGKTYQIKVGA